MLVWMRRARRAGVGVLFIGHATVVANLIEFTGLDEVLPRSRSGGVIADEVQARVAQAIASSEVTAQGDASRMEVVVVSPAFEGMSRVAKQQLVYAAIAELIRDGALHAVTIRAYTPAEARGVMDKLLIEGGNALRGELRMSGAKNSTLPILAATLLADEPGRDCERSAPARRHDDDRTARQSRCRGHGRRKLNVSVGSASLNSYRAPYDLVKTMRASFTVLGPLLARYGRAEVSLPGGCAIGARPVDQHLKGLTAMGADIRVEDGYVIAKATGRLRGTHILMDITTVGGTENLMMAATLAQGTTVLENAAREPEIVDLAECLIAMGAAYRGPWHRENRCRRCRDAARMSPHGDAGSRGNGDLSDRGRGDRRAGSFEGHASRDTRVGFDQAGGSGRGAEPR